MVGETKRFCSTEQHRSPQKKVVRIQISTRTWDGPCTLSSINYNLTRTYTTGTQKYTEELARTNVFGSATNAW